MGSRRRGLILLMLFAFALRMFQLGGQEFWLDEATSAVISGMGWKGTLAYVRAAPWEHPPLYYLSLYPWQRLVGTGEFALRFYSVFFGTLFVPLLYSLVRRLATERLAWLAALLATLSPYMIAYSQEARMYSLAPTLALAAVLSFWAALQRKRQPLWWLAYLGLLAAGLMTHYYFVLIWAATTAYLILEWLHRRRLQRWPIVVQGAFLLVGLVWLVSAPGLRDSLLSVGQTVEDFSLAYKLGTLMPTLILSEIVGGEFPPVIYALAAAGWILIVYGAVTARRAQLIRSRAWELLALLLVVPLIGSLFLIWVKGRHLGFVLIPGFVFMALGLAALRRQGRAALLVGILAFLIPSAYGLAVHYRSSNGDFDRAMTYIDQRGQPGDVLILTHPHQWPLVNYYNDREWPVHYVPDSAEPPAQAEVDEALGALSREHRRLWLGPAGAWTADPERLVDRWLATHAFQAEKIWFPDSTSVALYLTGSGDLNRVETGSLVWGSQIRLFTFSANSFEVRPGEAMLLRFVWQPETILDERYEVSLLLVDEQGQVWSERRSEPCSSWCPTDTWTAGQPIQDQHALEIPPGTPPGDYRLMVAWTALAGGRALPLEENDRRVVNVPLAGVTVLPAQEVATAPESLPNGAAITFGDEISLLGFQPKEAEVKPGEVLHLETYWRAETSPGVDYALWIDLVDEWDYPLASWERAPAAAFYPTSLWRAGEFSRGQHDLLLPNTLGAGYYELRIGLVSPTGKRLPVHGQVAHKALDGLLSWDEPLSGEELALTSVEIVDRQRRFDVPPVEQQTDVTVGRHARLLGYNLDLSRSQPGGKIHLTAIWQADGPLVRPFKVFVHLLDKAGTIVAQHDAPPGGGCCPTNTWVGGEVIVDEHPLVLNADLPAGEYWIVLGMYDEDLDTRLPVHAADGGKLEDDRIPIGPVTVQPAQVREQEATAVAEPRFKFEYQLFLPVVGRGRE